MLKESLIENNSIKLNQSAANWEDAIKSALTHWLLQAPLSRVITTTLSPK